MRIYLIPFIVSTAFIRSIIGECLHSIKNLGGLVVSVPTFGFITNLYELEEKIDEKYLFSEFKNIRMLLAKDSRGLELKKVKEKELEFRKGIRLY